MAYHAFQESPFKNKLGQTINVGDRVIAVAKGRGARVHIRMGMYLGRRDNRPTVQVVEKVKRWETAGGYETYSSNPSAQQVERTVTNRRTFPSGNVFLTV